MDGSPLARLACSLSADWAGGIKSSLLSGKEIKPGLVHSCEYFSTTNLSKACRSLSLTTEGYSLSVVNVFETSSHTQCHPVN